jgi:hypothetical protein
MPEQTYSIGFGENDFFYSNTNQTSNTNQKALLETFPFDIPNLVKWCKTKDSSIKDSTSPSIIFNSEISKIIIDNSQNFIDSYMPGNITINNNFNSIALGVAVSGGQPVLQNSVIIGGTADIDTNNLSIPNLKLNISSGKIGYSSKSGQSQQDITLETQIQSNPLLLFGTETNTGGTSSRQISVSANTRNPRCKFVNNCTENHAHYTKCVTQTIRDNTGQSYCKCVCTGPLILNAEPHSHCNEINIEDTANNGLSSTWVRDTYNKSVNTLNTFLKNIKLNLKANFPSGVSSDGTNASAIYPNSTNLTDNDKAIRKKIYEYYAEVIQNKKNQQLLLDNQSFNNTADQINKDATTSYKKQYLELFNVTAGIFLTSAYIYIQLKK